MLHGTVHVHVHIGAYSIMLQTDQKTADLFIYHILKVHKREKFYSSDFEFFTILYLVKLKY